MVTVDDATYVKMKDTLYWGDAWKASKAKAQIESSYTDEQYNKFVNQLWGVKQQPTTPVSTPSDNQTAQTTPPTQTTPEVKQETEIKQQETAGSTVGNIQQQGALKPLSQDYYNQTWDDAQSKIISNLNNYRQTNPEYFRDYESFKKNFSYDARNDEQKQTLDSWYWGYQKWMELAWIPVTDLYTQYKDGQVSMNELENLRVYDPTKYAELQNQINKWNIIAAYDDDKWVDTTWMSIQDMAYNMAVQTFTKFMSGEWASEASQFFRDYEAKMDSPEMLALSDQCTEVQEQMENIQSDLDSIKKQVEAEYEWTWATRSKINAIIADRSYDLQLQLRTLNSEYNKYATQYNNRMNQYQNEFSMQLQEYQLNQQARNQQMSELWFAMDLMNFETNEQKQQREWDYWVKQQEYTNWNINSKDYDTRYKAALKSVQNLLSQYEWIPMQRSAEQMAQDVLKAIDNGSDLWAELTKINKQIQGKPEYKYLYNQTYAPASAWQNIQSYTIWDTEYVVYNGEMMTAADFNSKYWGKAVWSTWEAKPYDIVDAKVFDTNTMMSPWYNTLGSFLADPNNAAKKNWGWCGAFVNKYLKSIWVTNSNYYDDSLATKLNSVNTQVPKVWSIAVYDYWHITKETWQNHGHVWIVTKVYEDGSYDVIDSNFGSDKKIQIRTHLNPQSSNCKWFFDPSQPPAWSNASNPTALSSVDEAKKQNYLEEAKRWRLGVDDTKKIWDMAAEQWWGDEWREALKQWQSREWSPTQTKWMEKADDIFYKHPDVKAFEEASTQFQQLATALRDTSWVWDMSAIFTFMKTLDPSSVVRESEFNSAASTAWVLNPQAILQSLEKNIDWKFLTPQQRKDFKKIAEEFIKIKAKAYQRQYDVLSKKYEWLGVDIERWPANVANDLLTILDWWVIPQSTLQSVNSSSLQSNWYTDLLPSTSVNTSTWVWSTVNVGWYYFPSTF